MVVSCSANAAVGTALIYCRCNRCVWRSWRAHVCTCGQVWSYGRDHCGALNYVVMQSDIGIDPRLLRMFHHRRH
jgi:hypothetical protein